MIYVDDAIFRWKNKLWCHMLADTQFELHEFATKKLGLRRSWYQKDHYDITESKRTLAISLGAKPVDSKFIVRQRYVMMNKPIPPMVNEYIPATK